MVDDILAYQKLFHKMLEIHNDTPAGQEPDTPYEVANSFAKRRHSHIKDDGISLKQKNSFTTFFLTKSFNEYKFGEEYEGGKELHTTWDDVVDLYAENNRKVEEALRNNTIERSWHYDGKQWCR